MAVRVTGLWRNDGFMKLWTAYTASQFGEQITLFAIPIIAAVTLRATPGQMGFLNAAQTLPFLLFTLVAGAWVDRLRRRPLMIWADVLRSVLLLTIPLAALAGWLNVALLAAVGFVTTTATVFFDVADQSYVPTLVPPDQLVPANARLEASRSGGLIAGPGLAGLCLQFLSPSLTVIVNVATYAFSAGCLAAIKVGEKKEPAGAVRRPSLGADISEGLGFVLRHPLIRPLAMCAFLWNLSWFNLTTVLVLFVTRDLQLPAAVFGTVLSVQGLGMLLGAAVASRLRGALAVGPAIVLGPAICALGTPIVYTAQLGHLPLLHLLVGQFLFGLGPTIWTVNQLSLRQAITPRGLQGRVNATVRFITYGMRPVGAVLGGFLGAQFGLRSAIGASMVLFFACLVPLLLSPVPRLRETPALEV